MASSSGAKKTLPLAGKWTDMTLKHHQPNQVPEPTFNTKQQQIWDKQVLIPYSVDKTVHAFGGPKPDPDNRNKFTMEIFPLYKPCSPRAFIHEPYNFSYLKPPNNVFRSAPRLRDQYINWLDRVEHDYKGVWESYGIFDLIQLSRSGLAYQPEMLMAALHFFESSTNTFHFECGMMTPTLLDVAAITGLTPSGAVYDPNMSSKSIKITIKDKTYSKYIAEHHSDSEEVSGEEHVAFLVLWLSHFVFCTKSLQVAMKFVPMAVQIHECQHFGFGQLLLGCLFECMRTACELLKKTSDGGTFLAYGPFWLLQLWLNATFPQELGMFLPSMYSELARRRSIEGTRLCRMVPKHTSLNYEQAFVHYFTVFLNLKEFIPSFAPFVNKTVGPHWYVHPFPPLEECEEEILAVWRAYLTPTVLSCRIGTQSTEYGLVGYFPNLVSRQFGLTQLLPKSIYPHEKQICLGFYGMTEPHYRSLQKQFSPNQYEITPFEFTASHACTDEFSKWWSLHYEIHVPDKAVLLTAIRDGFDSSILSKIRTSLNARGTFFLIIHFRTFT